MATAAGAVAVAVAGVATAIKQKPKTYSNNFYYQILALKIIEIGNLSRQSLLDIKKKIPLIWGKKTLPLAHSECWNILEKSGKEQRKVRKILRI